MRSNIFIDQPPQFVILQERSVGNEQVGDMWIEAHTFPATATLEEVWARLSGRLGTVTGRTMIRPDETSLKSDEPESPTPRPAPCKNP